MMHCPVISYDRIFVNVCYVRSKCNITVHFKSFLTLVDRNKK